MTEPIDWKIVDDALFDWLAKELDVDASQILWTNQKVDQPPTYPFFTLKRPGFAGAEAQDETRTSTDLSRPLNEEVQLLTTGPREITLTVTALTDPSADSYTDPNADAEGLLSKAQSSLGKRSVLDALAAAGIAIIERLPVTDTSVVVNNEWISQAAMEVRLRLVSVMTELIGYIDKVEISSTFEGAKDSLNLDEYLIDAS